MLVAEFEGSNVTVKLIPRELRVIKDFGRFSFLFVFSVSSYSALHVLDKPADCAGTAL